MDDLTIIDDESIRVADILNRLGGLVEWSGLKFKPQKSRSLSLLKGKMIPCHFSIGERIPTVRETGVKSLGRWYTFPLTDRHQGVELQTQVMKYLERIDRTPLPGRFKVWMTNFGVYPRIMWSITVYEISLSRMEIIESKVSKKVRKLSLIHI